jgi:cyclopropane fatty-acyl-phospholipid synthase-like methyltransferase
MDESAGYEEVAEEFMARRSASQIGAEAVREWATGLSAGAVVLDLGCGHGVPVSKVLIEAGHRVYGIDASPTLVAAFREHFPGVSVACEPVQSSDFFERKFEGVVAWGLMFLLPGGQQSKLIQKVSDVLTEGGQFLFTAPRQVAKWEDVLTAGASVSLGVDGYRKALEEAGLVLVDERDDEGENHYFLSAKLG